MSEERTMIVRYTNGSSHKFSFPQIDQDQFNLVAKLQELLKQNHLILELEGRMVVIPFQNIQMIELSPSPEKLPPTTIKDVKLQK